MTSVPPIAVQLYSLREQAKDDFASVLRRVAEIGYVGVELAGFHDLTPSQFTTVTTETGLRVCSAHAGNLDPDVFNPLLDDVQSVGCDTVVAAFLPRTSFAGLDAVKQTAETLDAANMIARSRGMSLGYHNHWWEFETLIDGRSAWSDLFERLDPTVFAELDIYWATVGGADPVDAMVEAGSRIRLLHVKDGPADDPKSSMVAVGSGTLDFDRVLAAAPGAAWHIVELDRCDTDMFSAVADSHRFLVGGGFSAGRT